MKLRNKKTGEIKEVEKGHFLIVYKDDYEATYVTSLAELCEEWEDYEEPKEHWAIDQFGEPINVSGLSRLQLEKLHRLGNDFPSENATTKAIEKLKALARLKNKGFRPKIHKTGQYLSIEANYGVLEGDYRDLVTVFGGEE